MNRVEHGEETAQPAEPSPATLRRWRRRLADEHAEAQVYRHLAERRSGEDRAVLLGLAQAEERHAAHWARLLGDQAGRPRSGNPRMRLLAWLAHRFGSVFVLALAQRAEARTPYDGDADATAAMTADERIHGEVVRGLAARGRARVSGTFRAAVFGANDGLVSNLSLVLGVTGGGVAAHTVLLTGVAALLAGALSMGAGEYVSVRSPRELLAASRPDPTAPRYLPWLDVDANELGLVYRARGMSAEEADRHAAEQLADLDPSPDRFAAGSGAGAEPDHDHEVVGTGLGAAPSSFGFFASGAAVPSCRSCSASPACSPCSSPWCWSERPCWSAEPSSASSPVDPRCDAACDNWPSAPARPGSPTPSASSWVAPSGDPATGPGRTRSGRGRAGGPRRSTRRRARRSAGRRRCRSRRGGRCRRD